MPRVEVYELRLADSLTQLIAYAAVMYLVVTLLCVEFMLKEQLFVKTNSLSIVVYDSASSGDKKRVSVVGIGSVLTLTVVTYIQY